MTATMGRVLAEHVDVMDAMHRDDVGDIAFLWGELGKGTKGKGGRGLLILSRGEMHSIPMGRSRSMGRA